MPIKKIVFIAALFLASCGIREQADELQALEKCNYEIVSADSLFLADVNVSSALKNNSFGLALLQKVGGGLLGQNLPLKGTVAFEIINPTADPAAINEFEYELWIKDQHLTSGIVDQNVRVQPNGGRDTVRIKIDENIYPIIAKPENQQAVSNFMISESVKTAVLILKIKPTLLLGNEKIKYPGFITINREINNKQLKEFLVK